MDKSVSVPDDWQTATADKKGGVKRMQALLRAPN